MKQSRIIFIYAAFLTTLTLTACSGQPATFSSPTPPNASHDRSAINGTELLNDAPSMELRNNRLQLVLLRSPDHFMSGRTWRNLDMFLAQELQ